MSPNQKVTTLPDTTRTPAAAEHRTRRRLIQAAVELLAGSGYGEDLLSKLAEQSGYELRTVKTYFRSSEDVVIALYNRFAADLESRITELPVGTLAERFRTLMQFKLQMMEPYRAALANLSDNFLDRRNALGVLSAETEAIRLRVRGVLAEVVEGSTDHNGRPTEDLSRTLYSAYLATMWLWLRDPSGKRSSAFSSAVARVISFSSPHLDRGLVRLPLKIASAIQKTVIVDEEKTASETARKLLTQLFRHRRLHPQSGSCRDEPCDRCLALHLPRASYFVATNQPLHLILPAFPAKSPNRRKTIGTLPDMAEHQALIYLARVCRELSEIYKPGVRLTICSDGHVFSDLVGVPDADVSAYSNELQRMLIGLNVTDMIDTFSLTDVYDDLDHETMRESLGKHYDQPIEMLRARAANAGQLRSTIDGIHRFLFEDALEDGSGRSRTQTRNECRDLAYRVVQRSDGWGRLLSDCFPMALRLSIHPQDPHSDKIGILLGDADDVWLTPWHGVAVRTGTGFKIMKRHEAENAGARLVSGDGEAGAYYEL